MAFLFLSAFGLRASRPCLLFSPMGAACCTRAQNASEIAAGLGRQLVAQLPATARSARLRSCSSARPVNQGATASAGTGRLYQ